MDRSVQQASKCKVYKQCYATFHIECWCYSMLTKGICQFNRTIDWFLQSDWLYCLCVKCTYHIFIAPAAGENGGIGGSENNEDDGQFIFLSVFSACDGGITNRSLIFKQLSFWAYSVWVALVVLKYCVDLFYFSKCFFFFLKIWVFALE